MIYFNYYTFLFESINYVYFNHKTRHFGALAKISKTKINSVWSLGQKKDLHIKFIEILENLQKNKTLYFGILTILKSFNKNGADDGT